MRWWWLLVFVVPAWYLSHQAGRLDRLHQRVDSTTAALEANLWLRAQTLAEAGRLVPGPAGLAAQKAAAASLARREWEPATVAALENAVTAAARVLLTDPEVAHTITRDGLDQRLRHAFRRVQLGRRFHAEAVQAARLVRRQRLVRLVHLAGHAAMPVSVDFADELPSDSHPTNPLTRRG